MHGSARGLRGSYFHFFFLFINLLGCRGKCPEKNFYIERSVPLFKKNCYFLSILQILFFFDARGRRKIVLNLENPTAFNTLHSKSKALDKKGIYSSLVILCYNCRQFNGKKKEMQILKPFFN
jgi:hypothetical protein